MISDDSNQAVLEHLLFHKAIIHEEDRARKIDQYLSMLREADEVGNYSSSEPLDRSIEIIFELVLSESFDPWEIDLMEFTRLYYERMKNEDVNFIVAGKLLFMAWSILRMQSEDILESQEREERGEPFFSEWDFESMEQFWPEEDYQELPFTEEIANEPLPLNEVIRRKKPRPVSLVELLDAFEDAKEEAERNIKKRERKGKEEVEEEFDEKAHAEELEKDVEKIWERIQKCGGGPLTITDIRKGEKEDFVTIFVSLLFLARKSKISIWQDDLPYGKIFFEVNLPWDIGTLEDVEREKVESSRRAI